MQSDNIEAPFRKRYNHCFATYYRSLIRMRVIWKIVLNLFSLSQKQMIL